MGDGRNGSDFRVICGLLLLLSSAAHAHVLIVNGGFEAVTPTAGQGYSIQYDNPPATDKPLLPGWTVVGATGNVVVLGPCYRTKSGFLIQGAQHSHDSLDLTGMSNSRTGVQQVVPTVAKKRYRLEFWVGNVVDPSGALGKTSTVIVSWGPGPAKSFTNGGGAGTKQQMWKEFSVVFTAAGPTTTLQFINGDPQSDGQCGLDSVVLTPLH